MPVQDDERERELVRLFNLHWDPSHQRSGVDATLDVTVEGRRIRFEVEVKSTTGQTVSTARDVGMEHIQRWRRMLFVIGFYGREARRPELLRALCLTPIDMEPWIASVESRILLDFRIAQRASRRLGLDDLFEVCGEQATYSLEDAKRLHKQQWSAEQYAAALDLAVGDERRLSPRSMLEILRLRSRYIAERGATLNNPHITKAHLDRFADSDRRVAAHDSASAIRRIAAGFAAGNPGHPALLDAGAA
jgi:hypothetical protein